MSRKAIEAEEPSLLSELVRRVQSQTDVGQLTLTVATTQRAARQLYASLVFQVYGLEPSAVKIGTERRNMKENYLIGDAPARLCA